MPYKPYIWLSIILSLCISINAKANDSSLTFSGGGILLHYPTSDYSRITYHAPEIACPADDSACPSYYHIKLRKLHPIGGTQFDSASSCLDSITVCSNIRGGQNYWVSSEGVVKISDPTAPVSKRNMGKWVVYETFWLCGWSPTNGEYSPYGGQCYSAVLSSPDKTVEFNFLLGEAGCSEIRKCWSTTLRRLRRMLSSVE